MILLNNSIELLLLFCSNDQGFIRLGERMREPANTLDAEIKGVNTSNIVSFSSGSKKMELHYL